MESPLLISIFWTVFMIVMLYLTVTAIWNLVADMSNNESPATETHITLILSVVLWSIWYMFFYIGSAYTNDDKQLTSFELYTPNNIYYVDGLKVTNESDDEVLTFNNATELSVFISEETSKIPESLNIQYVDVVDEMESIPEEVYIGIDGHRYIVNTSTNKVLQVE